MIPAQESRSTEEFRSGRVYVFKKKKKGGNPISQVCRKNYTKPAYLRPEPLPAARAEECGTGAAPSGC